MNQTHEHSGGMLLGEVNGWPIKDLQEATCHFSLKKYYLRIVQLRLQVLIKCLFLVWCSDFNLLHWSWWLCLSTAWSEGVRVFKLLIFFSICCLKFHKTFVVMLFSWIEFSGYVGLGSVLPCSALSVILSYYMFLFSLAAKDRVLFTTYVMLCTQLDPEGSFVSHNV